MRITMLTIIAALLLHSVPVFGEAGPTAIGSEQTAPAIETQKDGEFGGMAAILRQGGVAQLEQALTLGLDVNLTDGPDGLTPLMIVAAANPDPSVATLLAERGPTWKPGKPVTASRR